MTIEDIGARCYLRTSDGRHKAYSTVELGKAALRGVIDIERSRHHSVTETKDHKWLSQQKPTGSLVMWLADEDDKVIALRD